MGVTASAVVLPAATSEKIAVDVRCGACGVVVARGVFPPPPPFASLAFELRTLLKPLLAWIARKNRVAAPLLDCWVSGCGDLHATVARMASEGWSKALRCPTCGDNAEPRYSRLLDS